MEARWIGALFRWCRGRVGSMVGRVVDWGRQSGGVALLNHRLQAGTPAGVRICGVWFPVVSLVPRSTAGYRLASLRDARVGCGFRWCRFAQPPVTGGHPSGMRVLGVVSGGVASLNHRLQAGIPPGCACWVWFPVVSLRSTAGYRLAPLRDAHAGGGGWGG
jgi:hypothetical protein